MNTQVPKLRTGFWKGQVLLIAANHAARKQIGAWVKPTDPSKVARLLETIKA